MAENTKIQWCDHTFNPWIGCSKVYAGCDHCYAEAQSGRHNVTWGPTGTRRLTCDAYWRKPLAWERRAATRKALHDRHPELEAWHRPRVFCGSMCDVFEDWPGPIVNTTGEPYYRRGSLDDLTMDDVRGDLFALIDRTPNLDWLLCTKRPENIRRMWPTDDHVPGMEGIQSHLKNVWLLYSASDQETLEAGLPYLLQCRDLVPVIGLSLEPLLGPIDLTALFRTRPCDDPGCDHQIRGCHNQIPDKSTDWVIVGGESGPRARPCRVEWIRSIVWQCRGFLGAPCFVKQLGSTSVRMVGPCDQTHISAMPTVCESAWCRDPKGGDPAEWPEDLRVREFPEAAERSAERAQP